MAADFRLVGFEEAMRRVSSEPDRTRKLLMRLVTSATVRLYAERGLVPSQPFDMVYLVELLQDAFADKDTLKAILEDRYAEWFDDFDDDE